VASTSDARLLADTLTGIQPLGAARRGQASVEHARHQLFAAVHKRTRAAVLVKLTAKPGRVYEQNLANELATLSTINRELPRSPYFPELFDHGHLPDGRMYIVTALFDELPVATMIGSERREEKLVANIRVAIEAGRALQQLHDLGIFHVDLNPMNILFRWDRGKPVLRIIDFESSYERSRHGAGEFYSPPTTAGFTAPEVPKTAPDARADVYSLGAVLYTLLAGYEWTWAREVGAAVAADRDLDAELRSMLLTTVNPDRDKRPSSIREFELALVGHLERIWPGRKW